MFVLAAFAQERYSVPFNLVFDCGQFIVRHDELFFFCGADVLNFGLAYRIRFIDLIKIIDK